MCGKRQGKKCILVDDEECICMWLGFSSPFSEFIDLCDKEIVKAKVSFCTMHTQAHACIP